MKTIGFLLLARVVAAQEVPGSMNFPFPVEWTIDFTDGGNAGPQLVTGAKAGLKSRIPPLQFLNDLTDGSARNDHAFLT